MEHLSAPYSHGISGANRSHALGVWEALQGRTRNLEQTIHQTLVHISLGVAEERLNYVQVAGAGSDGEGAGPIDRPALADVDRGLGQQELDNFEVLLSFG